ncbi:Calx-beta domain-containing protein, partial [Psychrobacter sanguinis]|uniref:Calx-beta domain-containing protein n=1 Tax=Psychrobacter sanguinis TaxID=861445 RepID=UPI002A747B27
MKNIIVTTVDSSGVIAKHTLSGNGPTVINATKNANYEFFDNAKGYGPDHIITRRVDNDLKVSFERTGAEDDLIIKDFYTENAANNNSALIGASKEGEPYYYIPDSAEQTDFVTQLQNGAVQGNALGGEEFVQPWWIGGLPVLAALGIASIGSSDDSPPPPPTPPVNPPVVTITEDANNDGIISAGELDGTVGVLIEVHEKTQVGDTLIVTNPDGSVDMIVITQDIKDNGLVLEYPAPANDETIEVKAQVVDYLENASETSSDSAVVESPAIVSLSGDSSVNENNGPATYTISLDKASDTDTVVTYEVQNQTTDSNDFTGATTATVTIPAGQLSVVVEVGINDDGVYEGDENYNVVITGVTGSAELGNDDTVNTVIIDKDMMPSISVDDVTVSESLMGEDVVATFTVTLSHPSTETVEVSFNTEDGTAINGADYTGLSGTVTFVPGETTQTIEVPILDDVYDEEDETFNVVLSSPVNATLDHNGIGTITDEEQYPDLVEVSIVDNYDAVNEGDPAIFPIELRDETGNLIVAATEVTVTVEYTGTAINGDDYTTVSTTVTIPAGASSVNLNIETLTDLLDEGLENVVITVTGATGGGFEALGVDADKCVADVDITDIPHSRVEVNDVIVDEDAGYAEFTVTLTGGIPTADVSVDYATGDVTALNGPDYTGITGTLTFAAGTTVFTQTVQVPIIDDVYAEPYETYDMTLSNSVNATISHSGIGTITDEEQLPDLVEVSIVDNYDAVNEGDTATFPIELRDEAGNLVIAATNVTVTVEYTGTAINGDDYTSVSTTVTILAGESSVNLDIETLTDLLDEDLENVVITVTDATGGGFEALGVDADKCVADVDIIDSSYTTIEIDDVTVDEDAGNAVFTVTLTGDAPTADVTVDYATGDVTALDASDYTDVTGTLVFPLGTLTQTITVPILDDNIAEVAETYSVTLSNAVNATILNGGVGTITDECHTDLDSVYVSIVDNVDSVYEGEVATFTVELRDADGNLNAAITDVTVDIHYSGVAIDGTDYIGVTSVTIPANSSSVDFDITTLDDYIAEGSEIVNIELNSVTGGGFEAIAVDPTKATADMNIVDDCCEAESVVVSILDFVTNVVEGGNGVFPIELHDQDGNPVSAITDTTVDIHYSGVGIDGTDFTGISTIVIPAGSQSNYLVLETIDDNFAEGSELVNIELFNVSGGGFEAIAVDPDHNTADMNIVDDCDSVFVSILDFTTDVIEASSGLFPIVLKDADGNAINAVTDITVNIEYSGVAIDGTDFTGIASVVIPAGAQSTNLILQTLDDNIAEGSEIVNIELTSVSGGGFETIALDPVMYVADMNIVDDCNYPVTVSIFDDVDSIYEGELASFPIYLTNVDGDPQVALTDVTVTIEYTGSATNGDDYTGSFTVVIPAGASSVDLDIASLEDLLAEGDEIVDITISNPMGGGFEVIGVNPMADTANVTIKDSTIQITVEPSEAFEGDDLVHMVTLSNPSMTDETYSFSLTEGTATENVDYSTAVSFSDG